MRHELKTHPGPFERILRGAKRAEFRRNDRSFQLGDHLLLKEWDPATASYTGRDALFEVTDITGDAQFGIPEGFVMMSISPLYTTGPARVEILGCTTERPKSK